MIKYTFFNTFLTPAVMSCCGMTVMWGTEGRPASSGEAGAGWAPSGNRLEFLLATGSIDRFNTCVNESFN